MRYGMVIDLKRCIGCYACQIVCKAQSATPPGVLWSRVLFYEVGNYPAVKRIPLPVLCMHCENPLCVDVCPTKAGAKRPDGIVTVDGNKCIGCLNCLLVCPYSARQLYPEIQEYFPGQGFTPYEDIGYLKHAVGTVGKCDFCLSRVEKGLEPACVANCMAGARIFGDLDDPESEVSQLVSRGVFTVYPDSYPVASAESTPEEDTAVYYLLK